MTEISFDDIRDRFATNTVRNDIYKGYKEYVKILLQKIEKCEQIIDGSFTTKKENPNDIDICTFLDIDFMKENSNFLHRLKRKDVKIQHKVDGYFCPTCKADSAYQQICKEWYEYWISWFSRDRNGNEKELFISTISRDNV